VVVKLRERISVSKRARQKLGLERFDPRKLDDVEVTGKYQVEISNRFLQNLRRETNSTFTNKKREYLKGKINELET
jgi:hypothetical protein